MSSLSPQESSESSSIKISPERVEILWDFSSCPAPKKVSHQDVISNIMMAIQAITKGEITNFLVFGDSSGSHKRLPEPTECKVLRVVDDDLPTVALLLSVLDILDQNVHRKKFEDHHHQFPTIVLISGNPRHIDGVRHLGMQGFRVFNVTHSGRIRKNATTSGVVIPSGERVWKWDDVVCGKVKCSKDGSRRS